MRRMSRVSRVLTAPLRARVVAPALTLALIACQREPADAAPAPLPEPAAHTLADFTAQVDAIRTRLHIPGLSAIVVRGDTLLWEAALGVTDLDSGVPVTAETVFHLASLTKPFAAAIVLQLVDEGRLSLDAPVADFGILLESKGTIRVRHLLSHTSEGMPGEHYHYNGDRFARLDRVIVRVTNEPFALRLSERVLQPLALDHTSPNPQDAAACALAGRDAAAVRGALATGYGLDDDEPVQVEYPGHFSTAAGLVSTPRDVARFAAALVAGQLLAPATRELAWTPAVGAGGAPLPYGLGWFVKDVAGERVVWHYGYWTGNSSLIIVVPARELVFVALANSDQLSAPFRLGSGDLLSSPLAQAFVNGFVSGTLGG
jgi:CubicO group peptidase (beta-lactamase class C family)